MTLREPIRRAARHGQTRPNLLRYKNFRRNNRCSQLLQISACPPAFRLPGQPRRANPSPAAPRISASRPENAHAGHLQPRLSSSQVLSSVNRLSPLLIARIHAASLINLRQLRRTCRTIIMEALIMPLNCEQCTALRIPSRLLLTSRSLVMRPLSFRQRLFIEYYLGELSGCASMPVRRAGYRVPHPEGARLLRKPSESGPRSRPT